MSSSGFFQTLKKALMGGDKKPQATPVEPVSKPVTATATESTPSVAQKAAKTNGIDTVLFARQCLKLVGGHGNLSRIDCCVTRIRLTLKDSTVVSDDRLKAIGASAVVRVGDKNLQIVIGPRAEEIVEEMKKIPVTEDLSNVEVPA